MGEEFLHVPSIPERRCGYAHKKTCKIMKTILSYKLEQAHLNKSDFMDQVTNLEQ